jgi:hypothetical protein
MLSGCVSLPENVLQLVDKFVTKGDPGEFLLLAVQRLLSRREGESPQELYILGWARSQQLSHA